MRKRVYTSRVERGKEKRERNAPRKAPNRTWSFERGTEHLAHDAVCAGTERPSSEAGRSDENVPLCGGIIPIAVESLV